jgi:hypothetical protein
MAIQDPQLPHTGTDVQAKLETEKLYNKHNQEESAKSTLHKIFIYTAWFMFGAFIVVAFFRGLHYIIPESCGWLSENQLHTIDSLLSHGLSGIIGGVGGVAAKYLGNLKL